MSKQIIKGEKIKEYLEGQILDDVILSFEDYSMDFEKDLQFCDMHITDKGTCWIHDTRTKTPFWNGTLIATFRIGGRGVYFIKNKDRNHERLQEYARKRKEFFSVPRTAGELDKFEKENAL